MEIKDYDVMIDGRNFFDQTVKKILEHMVTFEKLQLVKVMITQMDFY